MIGKPEWFQRRKYGGWGIFPKTWQGWAYIAAMLVPFAVLQFFTFWSAKTRTIITVVWLLIFCIDTITIMVKMKKDEREREHEAIAERNALWVMIALLAIGVAYQAASSAVKGPSPYVDPVIIIALVGGLLAKAITNVYMERKC